LPNLAVLFTSGYTENAIVHGGRLDEGIELLSKPYTREAMARKIRHVLRNQEQRRLSQSRAIRSLSSSEGSRTAAARPLRVLLVEDDAMIRIATADMLGELGHSVTEAANGGEALRMLDKGLFDVIVTDLALPDISGDEVAARAVMQQPGLAVIFATGYGTPPNRIQRNELRGAVLLQKPYDDQKIAVSLRAALSANEAFTQRLD
jgi:CheY-like chemotaxis protein